MANKQELYICEPKENKETKAFSSRCSPSRVFKVIRGLSEELKDVVKEMGFGNFIRMQNCNLHRDLIQWLVQRFDPIDGSLTINNRKLQINSRIFGNTLGVKDGGQDVEYAISDDNGKRKHSERTSLLTLQQTLEQNSAPNDFVRDFTLYLVGTLLMPTTSLYVGRSLELTMQEVKCPTAIRSKNWASLSWRFLVKSMARYKRNYPQFICGCLYFFQLFYFQHIEGYDRYIDKSLCPMQSWSESETKLVLKWITKRGGFENVDIICVGSEVNEVEISVNSQAEWSSETASKYNTHITDLKNEVTLKCDGLKEYFIGELGGLRKELDMVCHDLKTLMNHNLSLCAKHAVLPEIRVLSKEISEGAIDLKDLVNGLREDVLGQLSIFGEEIKAIRHYIRDRLTSEMTTSEKKCMKISKHDGNNDCDGCAFASSYVPNQNGVNKSCRDLTLTTVCGPTSEETEAILLYDTFYNSGGTIVGPFTLKSKLDVSKFCLAMHLFYPTLSLTDVLFRHKDYEVVRLYFSGLLPESEVDIQLLGAYVMTVRGEQIAKFRTGQKCSVVSMPVRKKAGVCVDSQNLRDCFEQIPTERCYKVVIPILDLDEAHWYMVDYDINQQVCTIWDSMGWGQHNMPRRKLVKDLGRFLDEALTASRSDLRGPQLKFCDFLIRIPDNLALQKNCFDCGVFVMKYITAAVSNASLEVQVDPVTDRLTIALDVVGSVFNELRSDILADAQSAFHTMLVTDNGLTLTRKVENPTKNTIIHSLATKKQRVSFWNRYSRRANPLND